MKRIVRSIWVLSLLIFLAACLIAYTNHPLYVDFIWDGSGKGIYFMEKSNFFYLCIGIGIFINVGFSAVAGVFPLLDRRLMPLPNARYWTSSTSKRKELLNRTKMVFRMLAIVTNLFLALLVRYIYMINDEGYVRLWWLLYFFPPLILIWVLISFYLFSDTETKSD